MTGLESKSARMGALVLLGLVLFNPPLIEVFDAGAARTVAGIPLLYFYLFFAWASLIGLMTFVIEGRSRGGGERSAGARQEKRRDGD